ncbi:HK97 family phage prohead protease [Clostridium cellulovorans]|uniref:Phage prohead protease, HK97 family n=1 Tax=Clostridium cellulovorans (strain ATCC 35296 / DSM 3052 / OCM 3 / 743B) TaxID=573061 RepID=D9SSF4_CLOC7|nr:HK97 family phage prohead protease [Clostridium cellulovorans]ADL50551.1 phage prohead protease, HK97 family [Clostridium cellulovorans 743B]
MENKSQMERRTVELTELRVKNIDTNEGENNTIPVIEGHAAVFNQWSEELGGVFSFREKVIPGAFTDSIQTDDVRALFNHDPNYVLGRNKSGTLELTETKEGLYVKITPPDTQWARDLTVSIDRGDISQMSFGFLVLEDRWGYEEGRDVRELRKVKLFDVSPVTFPAYPQTSVGIRSAADIYEARKTQLKENHEAEKSKNLRQLEMLKQRINLI